MININCILFKKNDNKLFSTTSDKYKDTHSDPKWKKINANVANNLEDININFHEDKAVNIPSHCST